MQTFLLRTVMAAIIIGIVSGVSHRSPRIGAVVLTLPILSIMAFVMTWLKDHDLKNLSQLSRETLILVLLGLPAFIPLAFAERIGLGFWSAMASGLFMAVLTIGGWLMFGPASS